MRTLLLTILASLSLGACAIDDRETHMYRCDVTDVDHVMIDSFEVDGTDEIDAARALRINFPGMLVHCTAMSDDGSEER